MTIFLTGATGYIGSYIAQRLLEQHGRVEQRELLAARRAPGGGHRRRASRGGGGVGAADGSQPARGDLVDPPDGSG